jgi:hypothetical protein
MGGSNDWLNPEGLSKPIVPGPCNGQSPGVGLPLHPFQFEGPLHQSGTYRAGEMKPAFTPV